MEDAQTDVEIPDKFEINYLEMSDGAKLRHLKYDPPDSIGNFCRVFFSGFNIVNTESCITHPIQNMNPR